MIARRIQVYTVRDLGATTGVALALCAASLGSVQKYTGTEAALVLLACSPVLAVGIRALLDVTQRLTVRQADALAIAIYVVMAVAFVAIYPHANTHVPGHGSDRDDAANIGARGFLDGRNPYGEQTYLGGPISQLPGLLMFAIPFFRLFGSSAYQLLLWVPLGYLLLRSVSRGPRVALALALCALACPAFLREYLTGGDLIPNTIAVAGASWLLYRFRGRLAPMLLASAALGIALSSRVNFLFVLIPLGAALLREAGAVVATRAIGATVAVFAALTVPFALTSGGQQALNVSNKLSSFPGGSSLVLTVAAALAMGLATVTKQWTMGVVYGQAAVMQALFLVALIINSSVESARPDFSWLVSSYGVPTLLLTLLAAAHSLRRPITLGNENGTPSER